MAEPTEIPRFDAETNFKLDRLWSEFEDASVEKEFQRHHRIANHTSLMRTLVFCTLFYVAFAITDIAALGYSRTTFVLLLARCCVALTGVISLRVVSFPQVSLASVRAAASAFEVVGFTVFMLITWLRPTGMAAHCMSMCILLIVVYNFIQNKLLWALLISLTATIAFIAICAVSKTLDSSALLTSSMLLAFTNVLGYVTARRHNRLVRDQFCQHAMLRNLSVRDYLTGCFNRRYLTDVLFDAELQRTRRYKLKLAVILCDIDHFKQINDTHGHPAGDAVLRTFAAMLFAHTRHRIDSVVRYGGEEFLLLLPQTDLAGATVLAERMRQSFELTTTRAWDGREVRSTASFGVVAVNCAGEPGLVTEESLVGAADAQLYRAKNAGRNQVCASPAPDEWGTTTGRDGGQEGVVAVAQP
ncbi:GGDEF domain-containing protein [Caballeronia sordidicola]|uniref:GGDEF domain-containing protein n=1 Tax=Caballeronia sordidicola TaxID=196367 RepID=UPI0007C667A0|nr:diguanylate cyclase [Caballeronia sordidicola]